MMAVQIEGLDRLMQKLNAMGGNVLDALSEAVATTTMVAQSDARAMAPVDTGALKMSVSSDINFGDSNVEGIVFTNNPYAAFQEMGTVNMAAHPYMKPAADASKSVFKHLAKSELQKAIRRLKK